MRVVLGTFATCLAFAFGQNDMDLYQLELVRVRSSFGRCTAALVQLKKDQALFPGPSSFSRLVQRCSSGIHFASSGPL